MKKIFIKIISIVMLMSMCCSMMCISAMAETTTNTTKDAEGNTVITETTVDSYLASEGDNPAVSGEITTLDITVTSPDGQLVSESGSKTGTVVIVTENEGKPEISTGGPEVGDPVISDVSGSQLEVKFEDENGNLQFGTQTDSVTPEVKPAEDDYNNIDENTGLGSSQVTSVDGKETTVVTTEKTQSSTSSGPVVTTPEEGLTRTEVTETTTTVEAVTTQTVVVTDRELIGEEARVDILCVDLFDETETSGVYHAVRRSYSVIPDECGEGTDALVYTGTMKAVGDIQAGTFVKSTSTFVA